MFKFLRRLFYTLFGRTMPLEFHDRLHWVLASTQYNPLEQYVLDEQAAWLLANPDARIVIEGYCTVNEGSRESCLLLAESRARIHKEQLVARGVGSTRIQLVSFGSEHPLVMPLDADRNRITRVIQR